MIRGLERAGESAARFIGRAAGRVRFALRSRSHLPEPLPEVDPPPPKMLVDFLRQFGVALCRSGEVSRRVEGNLEDLALAYGVENVHFFVVPTGVFVRIGTGGTTALDFAAATGPDLRLDQVSKLYDLMARIKADPPSLEESIRQLQMILSSPPRFGPAVVVAGHAVLTVGLGLILNGSAKALPAYLILGAIVGVLRLVAERVEVLSVALPVAAAALVTMLVGLFAGLLGSPEPSQLLIPPLVTFLPGAALTFGTVEMASGSTVSGASRVVSGILTLTLLTFGILAGAFLVGLETPKVTASASPIGWWAPVVGVLVFGIGQYFHSSAPKRSIPWLLMVLYAVWAAQLIGSKLAGAPTGAFLGGLVLPLMAGLVAGQHRRGGPPSQVVFLPAFWMLVPGALGLAGVSELFTAKDLGAVSDLLNALIAVTAIALGVLVGASLTRSTRSTNDGPI